MKQPDIVRVCMGYRDENNEIVQCDEVLSEDSDRDLLEIEAAILGTIQLSHGLCLKHLDMLLEGVEDKTTNK